MNKNYELVIGIEIHLELNTRTKIFSGALNDFNLSPNTAASPYDLAYPGTLPALNKAVVEKALLLAKALHMTIDPIVRFDRKHYFYFDLPKNYQITQQNHPFAKNGEVPLPSGKKVAIERFHLEEDTAKSMHDNNVTLLNYNRSGVPLIEIVTAPVMHSADEAVQYIEAIRELAITLNISDAKLEEGSLRADINISVRLHETSSLNTKVEIKNLNSLGNVRKAIEQEFQAQTEALNHNHKIEQATKRFNEKTQTNDILRIKTDAIDYRYIPEPNLVPIKLDQPWIDSIKLPELPWARRHRYEKNQIETTYIDQLMNDPVKAAYFDQIHFESKADLAKVFFAEIVQMANAKNVAVSELQIRPSDISDAMQLVQKNTISGKQLKKLLTLLPNNHEPVMNIVKKENMILISDPKILTQIIDEIIEKNSKFIQENHDRIERVHKFVLGEVMKQTKGQGDPIMAAKIASDKIK